MFALIIALESKIPREYLSGGTRNPEYDKALVNALGALKVLRKFC